MPRGILFIGGAGPDPEILGRMIRPDDLVCAADSGLDAAIAAGIGPDGVVGDMDSISDRDLLKGFSPESVEVHPEDKDHTDTELGMVWLRRNGAERIILVGGGEGRLDHTLAIFGLFGRPDRPDSWFTALEGIRPLSGKAAISGRPGNAVSFAPVGHGPWKASSSGLRWELDSVDWFPGTVSLSNRLTKEEAEIDVVRGILLAIRPIGDAAPEER